MTLIEMLRANGSWEADAAVTAIQVRDSRIEKLEAALRLYACPSTCPNCYGQVQDTRYCGWTARQALEGKDD